MSRGSRGPDNNNNNNNNNHNNNNNNNNNTNRKRKRVLFFMRFYFLCGFIFYAVLFLTLNFTTYLLASAPACPLMKRKRNS